MTSLPVIEALLNMVDHKTICDTSQAVFAAHDAGRLCVTSDLHFNHRNIIGYSKRPFEGVEDMNAALWELLNQVDGDLLITGDLALGGQATFREEFAQWRCNFPHKLYLVVGNHDFNRNNDKLIYNHTHFDAIVPFLFKFDSRDRLTLISHYPLGLWPEDLYKCDVAMVSSIHGHTHQHVMPPCPAVKYQNVTYDHAKALVRRFDFN
jgi:calcineurin-like phosphoesterase family protein